MWDTKIDHYSGPWLFYDSSILSLLFGITIQTLLSYVRGSGSGCGGESGSESGGAGFSRDAVGRRSMSEKRHAALDAKSTGTYKKIKEIKAVNGNILIIKNIVHYSNRALLTVLLLIKIISWHVTVRFFLLHDSVKLRFQNILASSLTNCSYMSYRKQTIIFLCTIIYEWNTLTSVIKYIDNINTTITAMQVGPSLGMRKSSSLESLQTAIQENQRNPRNEPIYARAHPRKCSRKSMVLGKSR